MYPPPPPTRENRSPLPHISHDPRILVRLFAHRNSLSHYHRTLFSLLDSQSRLVKVLFSPTLARNTSSPPRALPVPLFFSSGIISPLQTSRPVSPHHITSRTASENKKQPNERASLSAPRVLLRWSFGILFWSGHSRTLFSLTVRDTHSTPAG
jgi:hypothetical protein